MLGTGIACLVLFCGHASEVRHPTLLSALAMPAPPSIRYIHGPMPGDPNPGEYANTADTTTGTVYWTGRGLLNGFTKGHETGHIFDAQVLNDGDRHFFQRLMHAPAGPWDSGSGYEGGSKSPSEWFADYYGAAVTGVDPTHTSVASYADIGPKRLLRFEQALDRLRQRRHLPEYR